MRISPHISPKTKNQKPTTKERIMPKIGLFGGSFNPVHNAHVSLASIICDEARLDEVWFMVTPHNPLKQQEGLMAEEERLEMVRLALEEHPNLKASDYEFHLERPSFTWNTLQHLGQDYPECEFYLIIGGDNWEIFHKWAHHEEILRDYHIIVYPRKDSEINRESLPPNVSIVEMPEMNVSSTMVREKLVRGEDISELVCPKVAQYLSEKNKKQS